MSNLKNKAVESEQALLGCALLDSAWISQADITADDFLRDDHKTIWKAIAVLLERREPVDFVTVYQELESAGYTGNRWVTYMSELCRNTPSTSNWNGYLQALRRHGHRVRVQEILSDAMESLHSGGDTVDDTISRLMAVNQRSAVYECDLKTALSGAVEHLEAVRDGTIKAVSTGVKVLDQALGGFHDSDLIIVAGRPAMGKTATLLNMMAGCGVPCGLISGEQPREQIGVRNLAIAGNVPIQAIRTGAMKQEHWTSVFNAVAKLASKPIFINDMPSPTLAEIQRQARAWVHRHGCRALYVDYLQKIDSGQSDRKKFEQVGTVVSGLKSLARELNIPIICLAQVKREVETRSNKRPSMADISDSSEVEKEADQVITLYRDEVYNENTEQRGIIELNVCKNRHGPTGIVRAAWRGEFMQVRDLQVGYE